MLYVLHIFYNINQVNKDYKGIFKYFFSKIARDRKKTSQPEIFSVFLRNKLIDRNYVFKCR
jgi:hypothetical protein